MPSDGFGKGLSNRQAVDPGGVVRRHGPLPWCVRVGQFFKVEMASGRCQPASTSKNPSVYTLGSPRDSAEDVAHITEIEKLTSLACDVLCGVVRCILY